MNYDGGGGRGQVRVNTPLPLCGLRGFRPHRVPPSPVGETERQRSLCESDHVGPKYTDVTDITDITDTLPPDDPTEGRPPALTPLDLSLVWILNGVRTLTPFSGQSICEIHRIDLLS